MQEIKNGDYIVFNKLNDKWYLTLVLTDKDLIHILCNINKLSNWSIEKEIEILTNLLNNIKYK